LPPLAQWPDLLAPPHGLSYPDRLNAADALLDAHVRAGGGERLALRGAGICWTYEQLRDRVDRIAHVIAKQWQLPTGSRVLLRGANHPMLAACWLAVIKAGCIAVTTMPLLRERELGVIADKARINAALCDASLLPAWQAVAQERSQRGLPCPTLGYGNDDPAGLEAAMARHDAPFAAADTAQDDVALIAFTSGTTGVPKGTMHFHRDLLLIADVLSAHLLEPDPDDVFIGTPPLAFTFGLGGLLVFALRVGASAVLEPQWSPESLLHRSDLLPQDGAAGAIPRPAPAAPRRLFWRDAAGRHTRAVAGGHRSGADRMPGLNRNAARLHCLQARPGASGLNWPSGARLRGVLS
jgi:2-aminobenzoate-CoA ligase